MTKPSNAYAAMIERLRVMIRKVESSATARWIEVGREIEAWRKKERVSVREVCRKIGYALEATGVRVSEPVLYGAARVAATLTDAECRVVVGACMPMRDVMFLCSGHYTSVSRASAIEKIERNGRVPNMARKHYQWGSACGRRMEAGREGLNREVVEVKLPNGDEASMDEFKTGLKSLQSRVSKTVFDRVGEENWRELKRS